MKGLLGRVGRRGGFAGCRSLHGKAEQLLALSTFCSTLRGGAYLAAEHLPVKTALLGGV